ncbi:MAG: hypothetical protein NUW12_02700 [Firmicutes bacterium]|nr:hypothetical protein [Bacillota bacterium]MDH7494644.1 hypothetical protein [Bacillota bacterium]
MFIANLNHMDARGLRPIAATLRVLKPAQLVRLSAEAALSRSGGGGAAASFNAALAREIVDVEKSLCAVGDRELRTLIREEIAVRSGLGRAFATGREDALLARAALMKAAPLYGVRHADRLPVETLERLVYEGFVREMVNRLTTSLANQHPNDAAGLEDAIERRLLALSKAERRAIQEDLGLQELTGRTLRAFVARGGLATLLLGGATAAGFGVYLAATTVAHALFTTVLGVTLPFVAYTTLTGGLAFLLCPLGALAVVGGLGALGYWRLRCSLGQRVLAWLIVILVEEGARPPQRA